MTWITECLLVIDAALPHNKLNSSERSGDFAMKSFCFSNRQTAAVFGLLKSLHTAELKGMLDQSQGEAADSHLKPDADDSLVSDDGRVIKRLSEKLEEYMDGVIEERFGEFMDGEALDDIAKTAFRVIDYKCLAEAVYYGVQPVDPAELEGRRPEWQ